MFFYKVVFIICANQHMQMLSVISMIVIPSHLFFFLYLFSIHSLSVGANNTLVVTQSLFRSQTLVSLAETFELGFIKPGESPKYYIEIWYKKVKTRTVLWVVNRETPISDTFSSLQSTI